MVNIRKSRNIAFVLYKVIFDHDNQKHDFYQHTFLKRFLLIIRITEIGEISVLKNKILCLLRNVSNLNFFMCFKDVHLSLFVI